MEESKNTITCPRCGEIINVSEVLFDQVKEQLQKDFDARDAEKEEDYRQKLQDLESAKAELEKSKKSLGEEVENAVKVKLNAEKTILVQSLRKQIDEEKSEQFKTLQDELNEKSEQVKELDKIKAEKAKLIREKEELKTALEAELQETLNIELAKEKEKIKKTESEKSQTELQKRDKMIADLNKRLTEAQLKIDQGSNKLAGEVKEIELRDFLKATFHFDDINDVPSGITGADIIQVVKNNAGQESGMILYERKQTQAFNKDWISKDESLGKEKEAAIKKFAEREAHIFQAKQSMLNFWGRVEGIATDSLNREMKMLEGLEQKQIE